MIRICVIILTAGLLTGCSSDEKKQPGVIENVILITTDGLRWQDLFGGMDSTIAVIPKFNEGDSAYIFEKYWGTDPETRRSKLMPFFWSVVSKEGQVHGNRLLGSRVDNANPYWFSYPGYNEILTGYPDTAINRNDYPPNPHTTVLEFINRQPGYTGKVAVFGAWEAFDRIVNEQRSGIPVASAMDEYGGTAPTDTEKLLNHMLRDSYKPWLDHECLDVFTHYAAMEHLKVRKPRMLYIAYGETDEWAHAGKYRSYLDAARQVDKWIQEIWEYVQSDPQYKDKTAIFITTDHGRGDLKKEEWTSHGSSIEGASQIWFAALGPGIAATGESRREEQYYQKQYAQTLARLLGLTYTASHPIGDPIDLSK